VGWEGRTRTPDCVLQSIYRNSPALKPVDSEDIQIDTIVLHLLIDTAREKTVKYFNDYQITNGIAALSCSSATYTTTTLRALLLKAASPLTS
jgi:hypothetical protein